MMPKGPKAALINVLRNGESTRPVLHADFKLFVKQCHPAVRLLKTVCLLETLESSLVEEIE